MKKNIICAPNPKRFANCAAAIIITKQQQGLVIPAQGCEPATIHQSRK